MEAWQGWTSHHCCSCTMYCAISINSAGHVMHYMPAEILISADGGNDRYIAFFSADRGERLQGTHLEITLVTMIGTIIWNIWHSSWILQRRIFLPIYHPHQTWLKGGMKSCERIDQQHLQVDTCVDCSILGNFSISQAWAGLHFNVITHKVLHGSKIPAEFLYEFFAFLTNFLMNSAVGQNDRYLHYISVIWEGLLCITAELIEMAQ